MRVDAEVNAARDESIQPQNPRCRFGDCFDAFCVCLILLLKVCQSSGLITSAITPTYLGVAPVGSMYAGKPAGRSHVSAVQLPIVDTRASTSLSSRLRPTPDSQPAPIPRLSDSASLTLQAADCRESAVGGELLGGGWWKCRDWCLSQIVGLKRVAAGRMNTRLLPDPR